jgi:isopenicillin-N N-acyltransferase-like protein
MPNRIEKLKVLALEGPPYNRGLVHGKTLKEQIHEAVRLWKNELAQEYSMEADSFIRHFVQQTDYAPAMKKWAPGLLEEIEGIAGGSGLDFDTVFVFQLADEYWVNGEDITRNKCSSLGFSKDGELPAYVAQNMDLECFRDGFQVVLHIRHSDLDLESFVLSQAGFIGFNGMNDKAVGICCNTLSQLSHCRDGLPVACIIRGVLQRQTEDDAVAFLRCVKHASGQNYVIGGPGKVYDFECSANTITPYRPEAGGNAVWHTNHPLVNEDYDAKYRALLKEKEKLVEDQEDTWVRLESLEKRLTKRSVVRGVNLIKTTLAARDAAKHPVCRRVTKKDWFTFASTIMMLSATPEFHVAPGPPDMTPYERLSFTSHPPDSTCAT